MKRQMTIGEYRGIDIFFFLLMMTVSETVIHTAATKWFPSQPYTVSVVSAIVAIVLMRWNAYAAIPAAVGGLVTSLVSGATKEQILIYMAGNLFSLISLALMKALGKQRICEDALLTVFFAICTLLFMQAGRAIVALVLGAAPKDCLGFFTTDALSGLFAAVIMWIARRIDGLFEDQKHYLLRIHREGEKEDAK